MQKIVPQLWFDKQAEEAAEFYTTIFSNSKILNKTYYTEAGLEIHGQPAGRAMTINFELESFQFVALNGGPIFQINPSISFSVTTKSPEEAETLWNHLIEDGEALMEFGQYPFSQKYGWLKDKFGVSWQISYNGNNNSEQTEITPSFLFVNENCGKAEGAINYYTAIFQNSKVEMLSRYGENPGPDKPESINYATFKLENQNFIAMDSALNHQFDFNEGVSLMVYCLDQIEVDYYWDKLIVDGDPAAQQCGWLKDKFGVSWQIIPIELDHLMSSEDREQVKRVTNAFLKMKKFDIEALKNA